MEDGKVRTNQHQGLWGLQAVNTMSHGKKKKIGGIKMKSKNNKNRRKVEIGANEGVHNEGAGPC